MMQRTSTPMPMPRPTWFSVLAVLLLCSAFRRSPTLLASRAWRKQIKKKKKKKVSNKFDSTVIGPNEGGLPIGSSAHFPAPTVVTGKSEQHRGINGPFADMSKPEQRVATPGKPAFHFRFVFIPGHPVQVQLSSAVFGNPVGKESGTWMYLNGLLKVLNYRFCHQLPLKTNCLTFP